MTRESKLALIIGFVLVLVVGVLVSDHFSQANSMSLDTNQPGDGRLVAPITDLGRREQQGINNAIPSVASGVPTNPAAGSSAPRYAANPAFQQQPQGPSQNRSQLGQSADDPGHAPVIISNSGGSIIDRAIEEARRRVNQTDLPAAAQPAREQAPAGIDELPAPRYAKYTVVSGDSLIKIARRYLRDGDRWREIHELNADRLGPDAILQVGMTLRLPSDARVGAVSGQQPKATPSSAQARRVRDYVVVPGDTLGEISMKLLGTSKRLDEIAQLNGLGSPDEIYVGMKLKIPAE